MIVWIIFLVQVIKAHCMTYLIPFDKCAQSIIKLDMNKMESILIEGKIINKKSVSLPCAFKVIPSGFFMSRLIGSRIYQFQSHSSNAETASLVLLSRNDVSMFSIPSNGRLNELEMLHLMRDHNFSPRDMFVIRISIPPSSIVLLKMLLVNIYYCSRHVADTFDCGQSINISRICISSHLMCDGIVNCLASDIDETTTCSKNSNYTIGISLIILVICLMMVLAWFLFRMVSCVSPNMQNHLNRMNLNALGFPNIFRFGMQRDRTSTSTPDNLLPPPPHFLTSARRPEVNVMPPSYSQGSMPGVYPDFFKRFFGRLSLSTMNSTKLTKSQQSVEEVPLAVPAVVPA